MGTLTERAFSLFLCACGLESPTKRLHVSQPWWDGGKASLALPRILGAAGEAEGTGQRPPPPPATEARLRERGESAEGNRGFSANTMGSREAGWRENKITQIPPVPARTGLMRLNACLSVVKEINCGPRAHLTRRKTGPPAPLWTSSWLTGLECLGRSPSSLPSTCPILTCS